MPSTPKKSNKREQDYKTPKKQKSTEAKTPKSRVLKKVNNLQYYDHATGSLVTNAGSDDAVEKIVEDLNNDADTSKTRRKSCRIRTPTKRYDSDFLLNSPRDRGINHNRNAYKEETTDEEDEKDSYCDIVCDSLSKPKPGDLKLLEENVEMPGRAMFGFNTPKKKGGMALVALNTPKLQAIQKTPGTPKTPKTPSRLSKISEGKTPKKSIEPKTPSHIRRKLKNQIAKLVETDSGSDFSVDDSDFSPLESESSSSDNETSDTNNEEADDEPKSPCKGRKAIVVPILPKTPSAASTRQSSRIRKETDYVPECETYFQSHSNNKILTSDHTLDRLKNPRLPADRLFSLLSEMKLSPEHEAAINALMEEYKSYFPKWLYILNEGFNILLYGLGSKRQLLQAFHRIVLSQQTVLVINGFFPSLTIKDILDSITNDILDAGVSPSNHHEAVDMIEEEFALIPETHLYLIIHNLEGTMLRNSKAQSIIARLVKVPNIHMLASVDHINTPLLWDQTNLNNFNFSWWDCTTMLPYSDETAFENSLLVKNSDELALSSMRSVFMSLTTNTKGIYMIIVKYQLKNKSNQNYQGMPFKDLYWSCREAFLVSSDIALRAQLTEFLDHKLVKSKRAADGTEQLIIPIETGLLQQFLDEQEKKL